MKVALITLISCLLTFVSGYLIGQKIKSSGHPNHTLQRANAFPASSRSRVKPNNFPPSPQELPFSIQDLPLETSKRLEALKSHDFILPGYALTRLVSTTIGNDALISEAMADLMNLSPKERATFNAQLKQTVADLRDIESLTYEIHQDAFDQRYIRIPSFNEEGERIRKELLQKIEQQLGSSRRHLFEMQLLQAPTPLGNFGEKEMVLKYPRAFEKKDLDLIEIQIGTFTEHHTPDQRFQGHEFEFTTKAFQQRFSHLLKE